MSDERTSIVLEGDVTEKELSNLSNEIKKVTVNGNVHISRKSKLPFALFVNGDFQSDSDVTLRSGCLYFDLHVDGNFSANSSIDCDDIHVGRNLSVKGDIDCSDIKVGGNLSVEGDVDC